MVHRERLPHCTVTHRAVNAHHAEMLPGLPPIAVSPFRVRSHAISVAQTSPILRRVELRNMGRFRKPRAGSRDRYRQRAAWPTSILIQSARMTDRMRNAFLWRSCGRAENERCSWASVLALGWIQLSANSQLSPNSSPAAYANVAAPPPMTRVSAPARYHDSSTNHDLPAPTRKKAVAVSNALARYGFGIAVGDARSTTKASNGRKPIATKAASVVSAARMADGPCSESPNSSTSHGVDPSLSIGSDDVDHML